MATDYRIYSHPENSFLESDENAILRIRFLKGKMNPEDVSFDEMINSDLTLISVEFRNGKVLREDGFKTESGEVEKYFVEFFDDYSSSGDIIDYFMNPESDYRITDSDGTIIRLSSDDVKRFEHEDDSFPNRRDSNGTRFEIISFPRIFQKIMAKKEK